MSRLWAALTLTEINYKDREISIREAHQSRMANLQFVIGAEVVASDGAPAFEIDVTNITEGGTSYQIIRVEADRFLISSDSGIGPASRSNVLVEEFTRAP